MEEFALLSAIFNGVLAYDKAEQQKSQLKRKYEFERKRQAQQQLQLQQDYSASRSELAIDELGVAGQYKAISEAKGVESIGKRADPLRPKKIQLFNMLDKNENDLSWKRDKMNIETKSQAKAISSQQKAEVTSSILNGIILALS